MVGVSMEGELPVVVLVELAIILTIFLVIVIEGQHAYGCIVGDAIVLRGTVLNGR